jgi:Tat protein translocase TatB subunit
MNFLGVGPFELLLILVIATIVLGPERMAQAGRTLGRLYAQYRRRWQKDVDEMTRELRKELAALQQELDEIRQVAESEVEMTQAQLQDLADQKIDLDIPEVQGQREETTTNGQTPLPTAAETDEEAQ